VGTKEAGEELIAMLKPPGKAFAKVAVASTLCPGCSSPIEHSTNYTIMPAQTETAAGTTTKLIANRTLVIHVCTTQHDAGEPPPGSGSTRSALD
jgi:hypothetical protein